MAENIPFGYAPRGSGQQRFPSGNMRYNSMGMGYPRPQPPPNNRQQRQEQAPQTSQTAQRSPSQSSLPEQGKSPHDNSPALLGIKGLDEEKLILIAVIILLAKSGADWVILAALIYILM